MKGFFRRLRGAVGTALVWALGWGATATALWTGAAFLFGVGAGPSFTDTLIAVGIAGGLTGAIAGTTFSLLLTALRDGRRIEDLSAGRLAFWGGLAGIGIPGAFLGVAGLFSAPMPLAVSGSILAGLGVAGAFTAGGTVRIAQLAISEGGDRKPLASGSDAGPGRAAPTLESAAAPAPKSAAAPAPKSAPAPKKPAAKPEPSARPTKQELSEYDRRLADALQDDPEIAELLGDDPKKE